jgi:azurin
MKNIFKIISLFLIALQVNAQSKPMTEDDFYKIITIPVPEGVELEVGGLAVLPDGKIAACTRRGEVWMISNPYMKNNSQPTYKKFASGLHEPLGLAYINNQIWATQRGEVTILKDNNNDEVADEYQSFYKWPLSGNYHQYSYGPVQLPDGNMIFTLNLDWIGRGASQSKWRGWMLKITPEGKMSPFATGLRSPAGFGLNKEGDIFYAENQGDWVGSGRVTHLAEGDMAGNPQGLLWSQEPGSPVKLKFSDIPDTGEPLYEAAKKVKGIKPPAVWFPHTLMGISTSDIIEDQTMGKFGPFEGQMFVGDQGHSTVMRMSLEKINGEYQGACYPFREGFQSGVLRMRWGLDGSMFVGQTSRGWAAKGSSVFGLQRLEWTGKTPFEIKEIKSMPEGFLLEFTEKVDKKTALDPESYGINSFTYKYHHYYGSPVINSKKLNIKAIEVAEDGMSVRIAVDSLRLGYIHEIKLEGIKNLKDQNILHPVGYYTLNAINMAPSKMDVMKFAVTEKVMNHEHHAMGNMGGSDLKTAKRINEIPANWEGKFDQSLVLSTKPGLKFDKAKLQVKAGAKVKLTFNNNDDMLHNLLIVKPGTVTKVGEEAFKMGMEGETKAFVPDLGEVLFHTGLLQPESSETIYFTAPSQAGDYTFVCTFPGHYTIMQGILKVVK